MYYWSFIQDEEIWDNSEETIDDCVLEARKVNSLEDLNYQFVYVGRVEYYKPKIDVDYHIFESLQENAYNECGESSEGWLDGIKPEKTLKFEEKINHLFYEFLKENNETPTFGKIISVKKYEL